MPGVRQGPAIVSQTGRTLGGSAVMAPSEGLSRGLNSVNEAFLRGAGAVN